MILVAKDFIEDIKADDIIWDHHKGQWVTVHGVFANTDDSTLVELDCGPFVISAEIGHPVFRKLRGSEVS